MMLLLTLITFFDISVAIQHAHFHAVYKSKAKNQKQVIHCGTQCNEDSSCLGHDVTDDDCTLLRTVSYDLKLKHWIFIYRTRFASAQISLVTSTALVGTTDDSVSTTSLLFKPYK